MSDHLSLWAEIDLGAIRHNVRSLKRLLDPDTRFLAVVKANGYGHGDAAVAKAAVEAGADWLAVARVQEGRSLREAGIDVPILLLAEPAIGAVPELTHLGLTPTVYTREMVRALSDTGSHVEIHVKVDTGMHRYGARPDELLELIAMADSSGNIEVKGLWSHFAVADDVLNPYTKQQYASFLEVIDAIGPRAAGWIKHLSNSAGTITFPEAHFDMVRAGIAVYGIHPSPELSDRVNLRPAMSLKARVGLTKRLEAGETISYGQRYTLAKESTVATIPLGYADGLRRALTNRGSVLMNGRRYGICGTITMDHFLTDVGDDPVRVGDEVVVLGTQHEESITAQEIADILGTIPYEVVCGINARVPRVYLEDTDG